MIANNGRAGVLLAYSTNNVLINNLITTNYYGIYISSPSINNFVYNNLFNGTRNILIIGEGSNQWNTTLAPGKNIVGGSWVGGNYWAQPDGKGYSQTCIDGKEPIGICDASYVIDSNNIDYYPLAGPVQLPPPMLEEYSTLWDHYRDFYSFENPSVPWSEGVCYGMSETAILYYMHYVLNKTNYPYYPSNYPFEASRTRDLVGEGFEKGILNNVTYAILLHQLYNQPILENIRLRLNMVNLSDEFSKLVNYLKNGEPVMLVLGPEDLHAVVAWRVVKGSDGYYYIYISDPNSPGNVTYATYNPYTNKFHYKKYYSWDKFIVIGAEPLSFWKFKLNIIGDLQLFIGNLRLMLTNWTSYNYYFIFTNKNIPVVKDKQDVSKMSYFEEFGNSQSFRTTIPGAAGVSEKDFAAFAIPKNAVSRLLIDPPGDGGVMVFWLDRLNGTDVLYFYAFNVSASGNYSIVPSNQGFNITSDSSLVLDVTIAIAFNETVPLFNVYNITLSPGVEAVFRVIDWGVLNSTDKPSIKLEVYKDGKLVGEYQLVNNQSNIEIREGTGAQKAPAGSVGLDWRLMVIVAIIVVSLVVVLYLLYTRKKLAK